MKYTGDNGKEYASAGAMGVGNRLRKISRQRQGWTKFNTTLNAIDLVIGIAIFGFGVFLITTNIVGPSILGVIFMIAGVITVIDCKQYEQPKDSLFHFIADVESGKRKLKTREEAIRAGWCGW